MKCREIRQTSPTIMNDVIKYIKVIQNHWSPKNLGSKLIQLLSQHRTCWSPSTIRCGYIFGWTFRWKMIDFFTHIYIIRLQIYLLHCESYIDNAVYKCICIYIIYISEIIMFIDMITSCTFFQLPFVIFRYFDKCFICVVKMSIYTM